MKEVCSNNVVKKCVFCCENCHYDELAKQYYEMKDGEIEINSY